MTLTNARKKLALLASSGMAISLLLGGCTPEKPVVETEKPQFATSDAQLAVQQKKIVETVLHQLLTNQEPRFIELLTDPTYELVVNGKAENQEFDDYSKDLYGSYFTEDALDFFLRTSGVTYPMTAHWENFTYSPVSIDIQQNEHAANRYTFEAVYTYQQDGEKKKEGNVKGLVLFSTKEPDKIGVFEMGEKMGMMTNETP